MAPPAAADTAAAWAATAAAAENIIEMDHNEPTVGDSGRETSYEEFCAFLKLSPSSTSGPPQLIPLPKLAEADREMAVKGAMVMKEAIKRDKAREEANEDSAAEMDVPRLTKSDAPKRPTKI